MSTISVCRTLVQEAWSTSAKWQGNYAKAEELLREELSRGATNVLVLTCLGAVLCDQAKYTEAAKFLQTAAQLGSTDRNTYFNLGVALLNTTTHGEAMRAFNEANAFNADSQSIQAYFDPQAQ